MQISSSFLQPHWSSNSGRLLYVLSQSKLFRNGERIPEVTLRVAGFVLAQVFLKLVVGVPLITLAATADLVNWIIYPFTNTTYPNGKGKGCLNHFKDLISLVALPILSIGYALINALPKGNRFYLMPSRYGHLFASGEQVFLTPLRYSQWRCGHLYFVERMAALGYPVREALVNAINNSNDTLIEALVKAGADTIGMMAAAAYRGTPKAILALARSGVDPDQANLAVDITFTPMRQACIFEKFENAEALLEAGSNPDQTIHIDCYGPLPLIAEIGLNDIPAPMISEHVKLIERRNTFFMHVFERLIKNNLDLDTSLENHCTRRAYVVITAPSGILLEVSKRWSEFDTAHLADLWKLLEKKDMLHQIANMKADPYRERTTRSLELMQQSMELISPRADNTVPFSNPYFATIEIILKQGRFSLLDRLGDPQYLLQLKYFIQNEGKRSVENFANKLQEEFNQVYPSMKVRGLSTIISSFRFFMPEVAGSTLTNECFDIPL